MAKSTYGNADSMISSCGPRKNAGKSYYIHQNPVEQGLVEAPEQWRWSSARHYLLGESGPVLVNERVEARMRIRDVG